ncbi:MAG: hypothetical protein P1U70_22995 [Saprospiraceae bacterium]|nr:hypothetical protein [Saprospiraceae bacterium]
MNLCFYASEIAIITGDNKYQSIDELRDKIIQRMTPDPNVVELTPLEEIIEEHKKNKSTDKMPVADLIQTLNKCAVTQNTTDVAAIFEAIPDECITDKVTSYVNCEYGKATETKALKKYVNIQRQTKPEFSVETKKAGKFRKRQIGTTSSGRRVYVGGRMDGKIKNGKIIEVKNRMRRLFHTVRDYEKLQIMSYMFISKHGNATLVERFNDEMDTHEIEYDDDWFMRKVELLMAFAEEL